MYLLKVIALSRSNKSAFVEITREFGFLTSTVAKGLITINKEVEVGATMELPATTKIVEKPIVSTNKDTGETTTFTWVVLD